MIAHLLANTAFALFSFLLQLTKFLQITSQCYQDTNLTAVQYLGGSSAPDEQQFHHDECKITTGPSG